MALLVAKVPFWEGVSKGVVTICDTQKLCSAENTILSCFSKTQFTEIAECKSQKNRNLPNIGGCLPTGKTGVFLLVFLVLWFFCFLCFLLFLEKSPNKVTFLQF